MPTTTRPAPARLTLAAITVAGRTYPVLLPKLTDARLHTAGVVMTLHVLGQIAFDFAVSVPQIAAAILASALLELCISFARTRQIIWPASAMLTGSGVGLIMRVAGTTPGDHWTFHKAWLFALVAAASLATKYVIRWRGSHLFNPSNIGLVITFLLAGESRVEPLAFWWHGFGPSMALAYAVIIGGGLLITRRLKLFEMAIAFWLSLVAGLGLLAWSGHCIDVPWSITPVCDGRFWWTLAVSPEVLVFVFFMITDPKTTPSGRVHRVAFGISVALLATVLIAPHRSEFGAKVGLLGALTLVCAARPIIALVKRPRLAPDQLGTVIGAAGLIGAVGFSFGVVRLGENARTPSTAPIVAQALPDPADILARRPHQLPNISFDPAMAVFGDEYLLGETYPPIVEAVLYALDVEAEIQRRRRSDLLRAVDHGARLSDLSARIGNAAGNALDVARYSFETMRFSVARSGAQGGVVVGIEGTAIETLTTYDTAGRQMRSSERTTDVTLAVREGSDGRWLIVDLRAT